MDNSIADYIVWTISHLGAWGLMLLCAAGLGGLFLRRHPFDSFIERLSFSIALGLGLCSILLFFLALLGILYQPLIWVLTLCGALAVVLKPIYKARLALNVGQWKRVLNRYRGREFYAPRNGVVALLSLLAFVYWASLLITTQYPPVQWDAISQHLVVARESLAQHNVAVVAGTPQPLLPVLNHMLFAWAFALKDDVLAQMVEHTFLMLTALGLFAWGMRRNQPLLGFAGAMCWLANALVLYLGASGYVDIAATCFVFLGVYALRNFWDAEESGRWYLAMALLGMAAGVKLQGIFFLGIGALIGIWPLLKTHNIATRFRGKGRVEPDAGQIKSRFALRSLIQGWVIAVVIVVPWYAFIGYHTGNPLWPAFPQLSKGIWGAPWIIDNVNGWMHNAHEPRTVINFIKLPVDWVFHPGTFYAEVGLSLFPLIIAWPLAWIVSLFDRSVRWWTFWALSFTLFWFLNVHQLRYWLPALPLAIIALCESLQWILERIWKSTTFYKTTVVTASLLTLLWGGRLVFKDIKGRGVPPVTAVARENFLAQLGGYLGVKYVNEHADNNEAVCVLSASWLNYYFQPRVIDLRGVLFLNRKPTFHWPNDQVWTEWLESQNINWVYIYYRAAELNIPKQNPVVNPFWPDFQLVYADALSWVFHRKSVPPVANSYRRMQEWGGRAQRPLNAYYSLTSATIDSTARFSDVSLPGLNLRSCK